MLENNKDNIIKTTDITKVYRIGAIKVNALRGINLEIRRGEFVAVMGPSGSGKSTLMNIIGCLDVPTSGQYYLNNMDISKLNDNQLANIRNKEVGFVFQTFTEYGWRHLMSGMYPSFVVVGDLSVYSLD